MADVAGQLLGNEDFIYNLSKTNPNLFVKIYNEIKYLWHQFTGYKNQNQFIEDLQYKWEQAYKGNKELNQNTNYHVNEDISQSIYNVLNNIKERSPVKLRDYTPAILVKNGIKDLPMYENPSHIRKNILTSKEAQNLGISVKPNDHYHGLGKDLYIKAIDSLDNPRVIFKRNDKNEYLILTIVKDNNGNNVIAPIEIETQTDINKVSIDINRVKSVYGYDGVNPDLNKYIKDNLKSKSLVKIYEQKKQSTNITSQSAFVENNIPQSNNNVKSGTSIKYSIQESKNNTQGLDNSSFSLEQQLENQASQIMQNTQDMIAYFEQYLDEEGIVNPTDEDIYNSLDSYDVYDTEGGFNSKVEQKYFDTIKEYLNEKNKTVDNQGRKLTKKQQKFFKDSKARKWQVSNCLLHYYKRMTKDLFYSSFIIKGLSSN